MQDSVRPPEGGLDWLNATGPAADVVLSTRVRLARNLRGYRFGVHARDADRDAVLRLAREAAEQVPLLRDGTAFSLSRMSDTARRMLLERHLVSRELIGDGGVGPPSHAALFLGSESTLGLLVNEEDHLRLQALVGGFRLNEAWECVNQLDDALAERLTYAFDQEFGFLTSCPTNVGTGLRASVLLHLPGLVLTQEITKVLQGLAQVGLTFRGLYGEGSEVVGNFFQISNQTTLGRSEEDLIDHLHQTVQRVLHFEQQARAVLLRDAPGVLEDKVWRAYGLLRYARSLSFEEAMNLLSGVRLGVSLKLLPEPSVWTQNRLMLFAQTAHVDQMAGKSLSSAEADVFRAEYVRRALSEGDKPGGMG